MAVAVKARWNTAVALAAASAFAAVAALVFLATPAFTETTDSYVRVTLTGVVPALAILAVTTALEASSRVLKAPWTAAALGVLGCAAASVTYELWYAGVDGALTYPSLLAVAAGASVALFGAAIAVLLLPAVRRLPVAARVAFLVLAALFGGSLALLILFPMVSSVLVAAGALTAVLLMRRAESRATLATSV